MLYLLVTQLGWLAFTILLIVVVALYTRTTRKIEHLRRDVTKLQAELAQQKDLRKDNSMSRMTASSTRLADDNGHVRRPFSEDTVTENSAPKNNATAGRVFDSQHPSTADCA